MSAGGKKGGKRPGVPVGAFCPGSVPALCQQGADGIFGGPPLALAAGEREVRVQPFQLGERIVGEGLGQIMDADGGAFPI